MDAIYIPQLKKALEQTESIEICQHLHDFESLTPVQGKLTASCQGNYLKVVAEVETIVTLTCDRCLNHYNHRLQVNASELIWLSDQPDSVDEDLETEVLVEDLVETLSPTGYFEPELWLYEHLCLALPQRKLCDVECLGIELKQNTSPALPLDNRWASLASLKGQLPN
ncbi:MAG: YceD family protein [Elainellaceae cyanobacterium]